jgi:hypothetical protein
VPSGVGAQTIEFEIQCESLGHLRWDLADRPTAAELRSIKLLDSDGGELWSWDGEAPLFLEAGELREYRTTPGRVMLVSTGVDPRGILDIPIERLRAARGKASLKIELDVRALKEPINPPSIF